MNFHLLMSTRYLRVKCLFFNYRTNRYELKDNNKLTYNVEELIPYLSPSNTITIRYVDMGSVMIALPMLSVSGRIR